MDASRLVQLVLGVLAGARRLGGPRARRARPARDRGHPDTEAASTFDHLRALHLLVSHGDAHHYDVEQLRGWLAEVGFAPPDVRDLDGGTSLVVAVRAD